MDDEQKTFEEPTFAVGGPTLVAIAFEPKVLLICVDVVVGWVIAFVLLTAALLISCCWSYLNTLLDDVVDVLDDGVGDAVEPVSLVVLPRFLFAKSYISPKMPAKVLRRFFIVSSVSSTTDVWLVVTPGRLAGGATPRDADVVEDCDAAEEHYITHY